MDKEKIEEIENKISELTNQIYDYKKQINKIEIEKNDYTGKYIYLTEYGYMFVTHQELDKSYTYGREDMWLRGIGFRGDVTEYMDDFHMMCEAEMDWNLPYSSFLNYCKNGKIKVISKEEFKKQFNSLIDKYKKEFNKLIGGDEE